MFEKTKVVEFDKYCKDCKHFEKAESEDPCFDCLCDSVNYNTHKPTKFEEKEDRNGIS